MRREAVWLLALVLVVASLGAGWYWLLPRFRGDPEAPDFSVMDVDGREHNLTDYRGRVLVLDFMATWCGSCKIVQRNLAALKPEYEPRGVDYLSIDIDTSETRRQLLDYRQRTNLSWPLAWDTDGLLERYSVFGLPKIVVVNPQGFIAFQREGVFTLANPGTALSVQIVSEGELRDALEAALAGGRNIEGPIRVGLVGLAAFAGVFSFFSPCAFPLLPAYMGYRLQGSATQDAASPSRARRLRRGLVVGAFAGAGVLTVYAGVGLLVFALGQPVKAALPLLQPLAGIVAVVLGLAMLTRIEFAVLVRPLARLGARLQRSAAHPGGGQNELARNYAFGAGYGACAASCTAPVFLNIFVAGFLAGPLLGLRVFLVYALSAAALMVAAAALVALSREAFLRKVARQAPALRVVSGVVLVGAGAYLLYFYSQAYGFGGT